jgi:hypothetical protein
MLTLALTVQYWTLKAFTEAVRKIIDRCKRVLFAACCRLQALAFPF